MTSLEDRLAAVERRVQAIEDIQAIEDVMSAWHMGCNGGYDGIRTHKVDELVELFSEDGSIDAGSVTARAVPHGKAELRAYLEKFSGDGSLIPRAFQMTFNHVTKVDGDFATQRSEAIAMLVMRGEPVMNMGIYNNDFVRTEQGWKLRTIRLKLTVTIPVQAIVVTEDRPDFLDSGFEKTDVA